MNKIESATLVLVRASDGNPVISTITIMLFFVMFNLFEAGIERLIFRERFEHWLDPIFALLFIGYSAYTVWWCAAFNVSKGKTHEN